MPLEKPDPAYLWDMLRHAREVNVFVTGRTYPDFLADRMLRLAVERGIEIIGEAASKVSLLFRSKTPQISWNLIIRQRHRLAHEYGEIDPEKIWRVATVHVPILIADLAPLVPEIPVNPEPEPGS